jgi:hypothetical protein
MGPGGQSLGSGIQNIEKRRMRRGSLGTSSLLVTFGTQRPQMSGLSWAGAKTEEACNPREATGCPLVSIFQGSLGRTTLSNSTSLAWCDGTHSEEDEARESSEPSRFEPAWKHSKTLFKRKERAGCQWLKTVILSIQEMEIRRISVQRQPRYPISKNPSRKRAGGVAQGVDTEFKPRYCRGKKEDICHRKINKEEKNKTTFQCPVLGVVAHTCNLSYLGGTDREN